MIAAEAVMANRKASTWMYVKAPVGWRYCKPVVGKNNRIKPGWAHVNSHEENHPEASYYVRWREGNTFDTRGVCPACLHQWTETQCLSCSRWSPHSGWYER